MKYTLNKDIKDEANHTSAIEKIHYCQKIDKVIMYAT